VDTALAHLAGSMGIPTLVLLSADCDTRWGMMTEVTPWYDSWMLLRQPIVGDWSTVMSLAKEVVHARML
jgi:ADP-heptose:LPS heptosyltransferase